MLLFNCDGNDQITGKTILQLSPRDPSESDVNKQRSGWDHMYQTIKTYSHNQVGSCLWRNLHKVKYPSVLDTNRAPCFCSRRDNRELILSRTVAWRTVISGGSCDRHRRVSSKLSLRKSGSWHLWKAFINIQRWLLVRARLASASQLSTIDFASAEFNSGIVTNCFSSVIST